MLGNPGGLDYILQLVIMDSLDDKHKRAHVKKLLKKYPDEYYEWKEWCIRLSKLPDFFGTKDNPIPIDESKL